MKALVTIEVPDDGKCADCGYRNNFFGHIGCDVFHQYINKNGRALKQCRDAVQRWKEGVR